MKGQLYVNIADLIETGECECGQPGIMRVFQGRPSVMICDECVEYFRAGFNVVISGE